MILLNLQIRQKSHDICSIVSVPIQISVVEILKKRYLETTWLVCLSFSIVKYPFNSSVPCAFQMKVPKKQYFCDSTNKYQDSSP